MKHVNNGKCEKCQEIFNRFPGFHAGLRNWFIELQANFPDAHIACAGRGRHDQNEAERKGLSKAKYGQSAHNYNVALDIFQLNAAGARWDKPWFEKVVAPWVKFHNGNPSKEFEITWYGEPGSKFYELPHVEVKGWKELSLKLVE